MKLLVEEEGIRLDKFLSENTNYTRSKIEEMIERELISLNGKSSKRSTKVQKGDTIEIPDDYNKETNLKEENIALDILYEDDYILVVDKPSGMVVHPGAGNFEHTLVNALLGHTKNLSHDETNVRPGIVHRIDKDTSGVLLVAKTDEVHALLSESFKNKTIKRVYIALLVGTLPSNTATIDAPIGRDPNNRLRMAVTKDNSKEAITHLKVVKRYDKFTLVEARLETGRTHQIRVHTKYIGHPVYNDPIYYSSHSTKFGQFLHAKSLEFDHPITKEHLYFESPLPEEFANFLEELGKN